MRGSVGDNVKGCREKMSSEMLFKCGKGLRVTSGIIKGILDSWCTYMESMKTEKSFIQGTVRRLAEMEQKSLDGSYCIRRSKEYWKTEHYV